VHPKLIEIGDFFIGSYGVLIASAFLVAVWVVQRLSRRAGLNPEAMINLAVYCALSGLAGAKLLMFLFDVEYYARHPGEIFSLSTLRAGGVFQGGLIVALVVAVLYVRRQHLPVWPTADIFAPAIAIGHFIGRLGCFMAGCCWGTRCDLPWKVTFTNPDANRLFGTPLNVSLHPTQLYESLGNLVIFFVVLRAWRRPHRPGQVFGLYLVLYSVLRFAVEFVRFHEQALPLGGPLSLTQWISIPLVALGGFLLARKAPAPLRSRL
jgi:phosphatidylglycerol:prolipoprotein diacylglycerol transferase